MRFTVREVAKQSGFCPDTIRKHADEGRIPCTRDLNNWRVFSEQAIEIAKELAGVGKQEPASAATERVGIDA